MRDDSEIDDLNRLKNMKRPANSKGSLKNLSASINSFNNSFPDTNKSAGVVGLANEKSKFSAS